MCNRTLAIAGMIAFLFSVVLCQGKDVIYGSMASKRIQMAQLRSDGSFLILIDTLEYRGTYSFPQTDRLELKHTDGSVVSATLSGDTLQLGKTRLVRWSGQPSAAAYLAAFLRFRNLVQENRTEIRRDIQELSRIAKQVHDRSGSFTGFDIPGEFKSKEHVKFSADVKPDQIVVKGVSTMVDGSIQVTVGADGIPTRWIYFNYLQ